MKEKDYINSTEKQMITDLFMQIKESVLKRCEKLKCNDEERSIAVYSIQDYIDEQNIFAE